MYTLLHDVYIFSSTTMFYEIVCGLDRKYHQSKGGKKIKVLDMLKELFLLLMLQLHVLIINAHHTFSG